MVLLDGVCLPQNNWVVATYRGLRNDIVHPDRTNKAVLELLAASVGPMGRTFPGVNRTVETRGVEFRMRDNLGGDYAKWSEFQVRRNTEGLTVELAMATDPNKSQEWRDAFHSRTIRGKCAIKKRNPKPLKQKITDIDIDNFNHEIKNGRG